MLREQYLPKDDPGKVTWLKNFAAKKAEHAALFNFNSASVSQTDKDAVMFEFIIGLLELVRADSQELTAYKDLLRDGPESEPTGTFPTITNPGPGEVPDLVPAGIFGRVSRDAETIKAHENYTVALGKDFGIIGPEVVFVPEEYQTIISGKALATHVELKFVKGHVSAVNFYRRLQGATAWKKVGTATTSPFRDETPLAKPDRPEVREYMALGVINNEEIGIASAIITVVFSGLEVE